MKEGGGSRTEQGKPKPLTEMQISKNLSQLNKGNLKQESPTGVLHWAEMNKASILIMLSHYRGLSG